MNEIWRDVKGYEGLYAVSDIGRVKSLNYRCTGREWFLSQGIAKIGYPVVVLCKDKIQKMHYVHRLVAEAFLNNPLNKPEVNHIDGNKENNTVGNLEWVTYSENQRHACKTGLADIESGWKASVEKSRLAVAKVDQNGNIIKRYPSTAQAAKDNHISHTTILNCARGLKPCLGENRWVFIPKNECKWEKTGDNHERNE